MSSGRFARAFLCGLCLTYGCDALEQFKTKPGEVFSGEVIGSDSQKSEPSFIRVGFDSHTQMDLTFDPQLASRYVRNASQIESPGAIDTYLCPSQNRCNSSARTAGAFRHSALEQIPDLTQDSLNQYDFPGGGRLRNYIFFARFDSQLDNSTLPRSAMVFVSLMEDGKIEVRVIASSVLAADQKTELLPALFGVFVLDRRKT